MIDLDRTIQNYLEIVNREPENVEALRALSEICIGHGRNTEAMSFLRMLLFRRPNDLDGRFSLDRLLARHDPQYITSLPSGNDTGVLVSAIVSTWNSSRFLAGCLEDLERQTIANRLEILVIDSASEQHEGEIVADFQKRYDNIRYERTQDRETVYGAWNRAIAMARGRYITNANTDDRHCTDALERMAAILEQNPDVALVYADQITTTTENQTFADHTATGYLSWPDWDRKKLLYEGCSIGPQPMWRRSLHDLFGFFDGGLVSSGDYEFWLRISQLATFYHIPLPLGLYLDSPSSIEHRNRVKRQEEDAVTSAAYRNAAEAGEILYFVPFTSLRHINDSDPDVPSILEALQQLETLMPENSQVQREYQALRDAFIAAVPTPVAIEEFIASASRLLLAGQSWRGTPAPQLPGIDPHSATDDAPEQQSMLTAILADAQRHALRGKVTEAVDTLLNRGIAAFPDDPAPYCALAEILIATGSFTNALQVVPEMPTCTDSAVKHEIEAVCHAALGDDAAATQSAEHARASGSERPRVLVVFGILAARRGNVSEAAALFRRAVDLDPACGKGWMSLGMLLWSSGDTAGALHAVLQAIHASGLDQEIISIGQDMARRCGNIEEAAEVFRHALSDCPDSRLLAVATTELLLECGKYKAALGAAKGYLARAGAEDALIRLALVARENLAQQHYSPCQAGSTSLCMIVKNEEQSLAQCLASVEPLVQEIVIVDTGSTDRTVDLAKAFGARILHFTWKGNFAEARNHGIDHAKGAWILVLDADEVLSPADYTRVREASGKTSGATPAWSVMTRNYTPRINTEGWTANDGSYPMEEKGDGWYPTWKIRLFPNDRRLRFSGDIHEMVETAARKTGFEVRKATFVVHHYGELLNKTGSALEKQQVYFELGKKKLAERPDDLTSLVELALQATEMGLFIEALPLWDRVLKLRPRTVEALFNKGYVLMGLKRYDEAMQVSRMALDIDPDHKEAAFNYGTCELYAGDLERALSIVRPLATKHASYPLLQSLLAVLCLGCRRTEEAAEKIAALKRDGYAIESYLRERAATLGALGRQQLADRISRRTAVILGKGGI